MRINQNKQEKKERKDISLNDHDYHIISNFGDQILLL